MRSIGITLFVFALHFNTYAAAASAVSNDIEKLGERPLPSDENLLGNLAWVIVALLFVIVLIVLFIKFLSLRSRNFGINRSMRTLGGIGLGQNRSIQVVELAGRIYVLGVADEITLLDKIDDEDETDKFISCMDQKAGRGGITGFSVTELLQKLREKQKSGEPNDQLWNPASSFHDLLQEKLRRQTSRKQGMEAVLKDSKQTDRLLDE